MRLERSEVQDLKSDNANTFDTLKANAVALENRIRDFAANREIFNGKAAEAVSAYLTEVHCKILSSWAICIALLKARLDNYWWDICVVDHDTKFLIETEYVDDAAKKITDIGNEYGDVDSDVRSFVNKYSQYLDHGAPQFGDLLYNMSQSVTTANNLVRDISDVDSKYKEVDSDIENLLNGIEEACKCTTFLHLDPDTGMIKYFPGLAAEYDWFDKLEITDAMIELLYSTFFDEDGNIDVVAIQKILGNPSLSDLELAALLRLMQDENVSYDDLFGEFGVFSYDGSKYICDNIKENAKLISEKLMETMQAEVNAALQNGGLSVEEYDKYSKMLEYAQILQIIGAMDGGYPGSAEHYVLDPYNIELYTDPADGKTYFRYTGCGTHHDFAFTDFNTFLYNNWGWDALLDVAHSLLDRARVEDVNKILGMLMTAIGFIPVVGDMFDPQEYSKKVNDLIDLINRSDMTKAEKEYAVLQLIAAIGRMGGGVSYVETADGYKFLGCNFYTPEALIKAAGLAHLNPPLTAEEAMAILLDGSHPRHAEVENYFDSTGSGTWTDYRDSIDQIYEDNYEDIYEKYGEQYPDMQEKDGPDVLPPEVIQEIINGEYGEVTI